MEANSHRWWVEFWATLERTRSGTARLAVVLAIVAVGWVDYATGTELQTFPLYFLPVAFTSARFGVRWGLVSALGCTGTWLLANLAAGLAENSTGLVVANTLVQLLVFGSVAMLTSGHRAFFLHERHFARNDPVTGLMNPRGFLELIRTEMARSRRTKCPIVVALVELDGFGHLKKRLGSDAGNEALSNVARVLRRRLRAVDLVARLGGDQFVIVMAGANETGANAVLEQIRAGVAVASTRWGLPVTVSICACVFTAAPKGVGTLLRAPDRLMSDTKRRGPNQVTVEVQ